MIRSSATRKRSRWRWGRAHGAQVVKVGALQDGALAGVELLLVGSPTRGFRPTEGIQKFLKGLPKNALAGVAVGGFDTRMDVKEVKNKVLTFMVRHLRLRRGTHRRRRWSNAAGGRRVPPAGFFVHGSEGPLWDGELERAKEWGKQAVGKAG